MASRIITKKGSGAPLASDLVHGELAVDTVNKRLYTENAGGTIIELGTAPSTIDINAGTIDGTVIGGSSAAAGSFTTISASGEIAANGGIALGDNDKATFGASDDLQIYHDGVSRIKELGTGGLYVDVTNDMYIRRGDTSAVMAEFNAGVAKLMFDGSAKLATTSTGIDVTGTVTADGLTVDGDVEVSSVNAILRLMETDTTDVNTTLRTSSGAFRIQSTNDAKSVNTQRLTVDHATGDVSLFEDTGTTAKFFWDASAESLGIGTTSPAYKLDIYGNSSSNVDVLHLLNENVTSGNSVGVMFENYSGAGLNQGRIKYLNSGTNNSNSFVFEQEINGVNGLQETMRIDSAGNVGIGTSSPTSKLTIGTGTFVAAGASTSAMYTDASIGLVQLADGYSWNTRGGSERMRIDSSGNVGIGTSSPASFNQVGADTLVVGSGSGEQGITIYSGTANNGVVAFADGTTTTQQYKGFIGYNHSTNYMRFFTDASERMRIDSSGNLLVGKTARATNTAGIELLAGGSSVHTAGGQVILANRIINDGTVVGFAREGTTVGTISVTASATSYNTSSDERLKENITDAPTGNVDDIKVRSFNWKVDGSHQEYGMVAQELEAVAPYAVTKGETEDDMWSVDYSKLVPMLIKEIQDLKAEVAALKGA